MSAYRWRENELDNQLMLELASDNPWEERIRELVHLGANVNSVERGESILMDALEMTNNYGDAENKCLDLRFIRLLVELGADVNFISEDGESPIMSACFTHRWEPVECMLQLGANPNHIFDGDTSPLSWADTDQYYHDKISPDEVASANLKRTVELLDQYGAKYRDDIFTERVAHWLQIFAVYPTGLMTIWGNIQIDSIQGVSDELAGEFKSWHDSNWDSWPDIDWDKMPKDFDRKRHNEWGRHLGKKIRSLLSENIKVEYFFVDADCEAKRIRSVTHETISC